MNQHIECRTVDDPIHLRQAFGRFATGVAVITTRSQDGKLEGLTANSFSSVSLDPPLVLWSLQKRAPSLESFTSSGHFAVNVLGAHQQDYCKHFATPAHDKFESIDYRVGHGGCPVLTGSIATFECSTYSLVEGGDHLIFIGRVVRAVYDDGQPLIFSAGSFYLPTQLSQPVPARDSAVKRQSTAIQSECCS
ncbi:MAG: flavin reductase family protein [Pseudaminobacter sp.]